MKSETQPKKRKRFGWAFWVLLGVILVALWGLTRPQIIRSHRNEDVTEARSNLRQLSLALLEFELEYGSFPGDDTVGVVNEMNPGNGLNLSGRSSNAMFRQLIAAGITESEVVFSSRAIHRPDGNMHGNEALKKGEVAFGYVAGQSLAGNPARILAFAPGIPGTDRFDPEPFDGRALVLRIDNSVSSININSEGHGMVIGENILSPDHPIWGDVSPDIRYPE